MSRRTWPGAVALMGSAALAVSLLAVPASAEEEPPPAPASEPMAAGLIVEYAPGTPVRESPGVPTGADSVTVTDLEVGRRIDETLRTVEFPELESAEVAQRAAEQLERDPDVLFAEPDWIITLDDVTPSAAPRVTQPSATWGIDRIDQRSGLSTTYQYGTTGAGVDVYVVDSGIRTTHQEFTGRVRSGVSYIWDGSVEDCNGHGTHVSGTIAGTTYGVAKEATIVPVRVFDCSGGASYSTVIAALEWIQADHTGARPGVVNMSLGGPYSVSLNAAVESAVTDGLVVAVSSGNSAVASCTQSPASAPSAITVNSSTFDDTYSSFSNHGSCSDIYAPGSDITSAWYWNNAASVAISGTSMASPHVAGAAARILQRYPHYSPAEVWAAMSAAATPLTFRGVSGDPNKLLYVDPLDLPLPPPTSLSVTPDYDALAVSWSAPSGASPTHYGVEYSLDGSTWVEDDSTATTSTTIDGLNPANAYAVRVRSVTADDSSAWVTSAAVSPLTRTVPGSPVGLALLVDDTSLHASWAAPASNGGYAITHYTVEYSTDDSTWVADDTVASLSTTVDGLANGTPYKVRVRAVNYAGPGAASTSAYATPRIPTWPSAPQGLNLTSGNGSIGVSWAAPADNGGRTVDNYTIEYSTNGVTWNAVPSVTGTSTSIGSLSNGMPHTVRVAATNVLGTGPWATASATPVAPAAPPPPVVAPPPAPTVTKPAAPTITEVGPGDGSVMVLWEAADDSGGQMASEFTIELEGPAGTVVETSDIEYVEFPGLLNGSPYRVRVAATNTAGTGDFSPWSDPVTPRGPAAAPTRLTGTAFDGGVSLEWVAPIDSGGAPIDEYVVQWVSRGVEVEMPSDSTSIRLATLTNGTRYVFRVAAHTDAGVGEWSAPLTLTPRAAPVTAPRKVTLERSARSLLVSWQEPAVGDPRRYVVAASVNGKPYRIKRTTPETSARIAVSSGVATIAVRVLAIDSYGRGPWSDATVARLGR